MALALGPAAETRVALCPGDYRVQEGGVFGPETAALRDALDAAGIAVHVAGEAG